MPKKIPFEIVFIVLGYIFINLLFGQFTYLWDGGVYYQGCIALILKSPFAFQGYNCFGHPAMGYTFPFVLFQQLSHYNIFLFHLANGILGGLAIVAYWMIIKKIFPQLNNKFVALIAATFVFSPQFLSNSINFNLDFGAVCYLLLFVYALLYKRKYLIPFFGTLLVFSKEMGVMLYVIIVLYYCVVFIKQKKVEKIRSTFFFPRTFFIPGLSILVFHLYHLLFKGGISLWASNDTSSLFSVVFAPAIRGRLSYLTMIFVSQFNWIFTLCIFIALVKKIVAQGQSTIRQNYAKNITLLLFIFGLILALGYPTFSNPRYVLTLYPFFVLIGYEALFFIVPRTKIRIWASCIICVCIMLSSITLFDPITEWIYGTFQFGTHKMLKTTSLTGECCGWGRDQLVYNMEYTMFHYLQNKIYAEIKPTNDTYIVAADAAEFFINTNLDKSTYEKTIRITQIIRPKYIAITALADLAKKPKNVYFIDYPYVDVNEEVRKIYQSYNCVDKKTYSILGYSLVVSRFTLK